MVGLFGIAAACVLVGAAGFMADPGPAADGVRSATAVVTSGEATTGEGSKPPRPTTKKDAAFGPAAGEIPSGAHLGPTADVPAVQRLDPQLRAALVGAQEAMQANGVQMWITSGWRTDAYQRRLYADAVAEHGVAYARTHVATPDKTEHTTGRAVDIGPTDADYWLIRNGSQYGLCQTYANEIWHFELTAVDGQCPAQRTDALG
ncbi:putative VanY-type carboxypeptidase [Flexivirga endophytica]|uniref:VanY-type carboxypeptidase n=1 Tax=Flexivirga endophytica TaxID=1849103 RepID=A0A916T8Y2_9MICO|nr:putative VanY-type carboxypeptidase [Flexivirga endophytica]GHB43877.1 putative VanY-type carboxypeptidase [Flexivirga endophytica]